MKIVNTYKVEIYVGLQAYYSDKLYTIEDVREICDDFVNHFKDCVTITPTEFRYVGGHEPGVIVGIINYPRYPRDKEAVKDRAFLLANKLLLGLEQYRVSVMTPTQTYLLESSNVMDSIESEMDDADAWRSSG